MLSDDIKEKIDKWVTENSTDSARAGFAAIPSQANKYELTPFLVDIIESLDFYYGHIGTEIKTEEKEEAYQYFLQQMQEKNPGQKQLYQHQEGEPPFGFACLLQTWIQPRLDTAKPSDFSSLESNLKPTSSTFEEPYKGVVTQLFNAHKAALATAGIAAVQQQLQQDTLDERQLNKIIADYKDISSPEAKAIVQEAQEKKLQQVQQQLRGPISEQQLKKIIADYEKISSQEAKAIVKAAQAKIDYTAEKAQIYAQEFIKTRQQIYLRTLLQDKAQDGRQALVWQQVEKLDALFHAGVLVWMLDASDPNTALAIKDEILSYNKLKELLQGDQQEVIDSQIVEQIRKQLVAFTQQNPTVLQHLNEHQVEEYQKIMRQMQELAQQIDQFDQQVAEIQETVNDLELQSIELVDVIATKIRKAPDASFCQTFEQTLQEGHQVYLHEFFNETMQAASITEVPAALGLSANAQDPIPSLAGLPTQQIKEKLHASLTVTPLIAHHYHQAGQILAANGVPDALAQLHSNIKIMHGGMANQQTSSTLLSSMAGVLTATADELSTAVTKSLHASKLSRQFPNMILADHALDAALTLQLYHQFAQSMSAEQHQALVTSALDIVHTPAEMVAAILETQAANLDKQWQRKNFVEGEDPTPYRSALVKAGFLTDPNQVLASQIVAALPQAQQNNVHAQAALDLAKRAGINLPAEEVARLERFAALTTAITTVLGSQPEPQKVEPVLLWLRQLVPANAMPFDDWSKMYVQHMAEQIDTHLPTQWQNADYAIADMAQYYLKAFNSAQSLPEKQQVMTRLLMDATRTENKDWLLSLAEKMQEQHNASMKKAYAEYPELITHMQIASTAQTPETALAAIGDMQFSVAKQQKKAEQVLQNANAVISAMQTMPDTDATATHLSRIYDALAADITPESAVFYAQLAKKLNWQQADIYVAPSSWQGAEVHGKHTNVLAFDKIIAACLGQQRGPMAEDALICKLLTTQHPAADRIIKQLLTAPQHPISQETLQQIQNHYRGKHTDMARAISPLVTNEIILKARSKAALWPDKSEQAQRQAKELGGLLTDFNNNLTQQHTLNIDTLVSLLKNLDKLHVAEVHVQPFICDLQQRLTAITGVAATQITSIAELQQHIKITLTTRLTTPDQTPYTQVQLNGKTHSGISTAVRQQLNELNPEGGLVAHAQRLLTINALVNGVANNMQQWVREPLKPADIFRENNTLIQQLADQGISEEAFIQQFNRLFIDSAHRVGYQFTPLVAGQDLRIQLQQCYKDCHQQTADIQSKINPLCETLEDNVEKLVQGRDVSLDSNFVRQLTQQLDATNLSPAQQQGAVQYLVERLNKKLERHSGDFALLIPPLSADRTMADLPTAIRDTLNFAKLARNPRIKQRLDESAQLENQLTQLQTGDHEAAEQAKHAYLNHVQQGEQLAAQLATDFPDIHLATVTQWSSAQQRVEAAYHNVIATRLRVLADAIKQETTGKAAQGIAEEVQHILKNVPITTDLIQKINAECSGNRYFTAINTAEPMQASIEQAFSQAYAQRREDIQQAQQLAQQAATKTKVFFRGMLGCVDGKQLGQDFPRTHLKQLSAETDASFEPLHDKNLVAAPLKAAYAHPEQERLRSKAVKFAAHANNHLVALGVGESEQAQQTWQNHIQPKWNQTNIQQFRELATKYHIDFPASLQRTPTTVDGNFLRELTTFIQTIQQCVTLDIDNFKQDKLPAHIEFFYEMVAQGNVPSAGAITNADAIHKIKKFVEVTKEFMGATGEFAQAKKELAQAKKQFKEAKKELAQAKKQFEEAKEELKQVKKQFKEAKEKLVGKVTTPIQALVKLEKAQASAQVLTEAMQPLQNFIKDSVTREQLQQEWQQLQEGLQQAGLLEAGGSLVSLSDTTNHMRVQEAQHMAKAVVALTTPLAEKDDFKTGVNTQFDAAYTEVNKALTLRFQRENAPVFETVYAEMLQASTIEQLAAADVARVNAQLQALKTDTDASNKLAHIATVTSTLLHNPHAHFSTSEKKDQVGDGVIEALHKPNDIRCRAQDGIDAVAKTSMRALHVARLQRLPEIIEQQHAAPLRQLLDEAEQSLSVVVQPLSVAGLQQHHGQQISALEACRDILAADNKQLLALMKQTNENLDGGTAALIQRLQHQLDTNRSELYQGQIQKITDLINFLKEHSLRKQLDKVDEALTTQRQALSKQLIELVTGYAQQTTELNEQSTAITNKILELTQRVAAIDVHTDYPQLQKDLATCQEEITRLLDEAEQLIEQVQKQLAQCDEVLSKSDINEANKQPFREAQQALQQTLQSLEQQKKQLQQHALALPQQKTDAQHRYTQAHTDSLQQVQAYATWSRQQVTDGKYGERLQEVISAEKPDLLFSTTRDLEKELKAQLNNKHELTGGTDPLRRKQAVERVDQLFKGLPNTSEFDGLRKGYEAAQQEIQADRQQLKSQLQTLRESPAYRLSAEYEQAKRCVTDILADIRNAQHLHTLEALSTDLPNRMGELTQHLQDSTVREWFVDWFNRTASTDEAAISPEVAAQDPTVLVAEIQRQLQLAITNKYEARENVLQEHIATALQDYVEAVRQIPQADNEQQLNELKTKTDLMASILPNIFPDQARLFADTPVAAGETPYVAKMIDRNLQHAGIDLTQSHDEEFDVTALTRDETVKQHLEQHAQWVAEQRLEQLKSNAFAEGETLGKAIAGDFAGFAASPSTVAAVVNAYHQSISKLNQIDASATECGESFRQGVKQGFNSTPANFDKFGPRTEVNAEKFTEKAKENAQSTVPFIAINHQSEITFLGAEAQKMLPQISSISSSTEPTSTKFATLTAQQEQVAWLAEQLADLENRLHADSTAYQTNAPKIFTQPNPFSGLLQQVAGIKQQLDTLTDEIAYQRAMVRLPQYQQIFTEMATTNDAGALMQREAGWKRQVIQVATEINFTGASDAAREKFKKEVEKTAQQAASATDDDTLKKAMADHFDQQYLARLQALANMKWHLFAQEQSAPTASKVTSVTSVPASAPSPASSTTTSTNSTSPSGLLISTLNGCEISFSGSHVNATKLTEYQGDGKTLESHTGQTFNISMDNAGYGKAVYDPQANNTPDMRMATMLEMVMTVLNTCPEKLELRGDPHMVAVGKAFAELIRAELKADPTKYNGYDFNIECHPDKPAAGVTRQQVKEDVKIFMVTVEADFKNTASSSASSQCGSGSEVQHILSAIESNAAGLAAAQKTQTAAGASSQLSSRRLG